MAEIGTAQRFRASHGKNNHEHDFKVVVVLAGPVNKDSGYIKGVDLHDLIGQLKETLSVLENKNLNNILKKDGFKSSGMESIATYILKRLLPGFPSLKLVKVWETDDRYVIIYPEDIEHV
jgi:6-pyruvoyl-tetrahydropterin synthase